MRRSSLLFLRRCLAATQAFSRIRIPGSLAAWAQLLPADTADSARHWPGVGLLAGMAGCVVFALVSLPLPPGPLSPLVAAVAASMAMALVAGVRAEESLAHCTGPAGLMLVLAAKLALLALLGLHSGVGLLTALLGAAALSRLFALLVAWSLPPRRPQADHPLLRRADRGALLAACLWCVPPLVLMLLAGGAKFLLLPLVLGTIAFAVLRHRFQRRGGVELDDVGFAQQVCEVAIYLGAAFGLPR
nr:adenosylcobinamide-GDP ribazoletransferase [Ramlibacter paludis]